MSKFCSQNYEIEILIQPVYAMKELDWWPCFKTFVLSIFKWSLKTGFTVYILNIFTMTCIIIVVVYHFLKKVDFEIKSTDDKKSLPSIQRVKSLCFRCWGCNKLQTQEIML